MKTRHARGMWMWALCALGCAESRVNTVPLDDASVDVAAPTDAPVVDVTTPATDAATPMDVVSPGVGRLVINELRARGDNWVELYNAGTAAVDLSNYGVADEETDGGAPRLSMARRLPAGTTLAPGEYLVVVGNVTDAGAVAAMGCLDGGVSRCFYATWSISNGRGETMTVINGANVVVATAAYPADATASDQSWGRLPNGTGEFARNRPTPGGPNAAP